MSAEQFVIRPRPAVRAFALAAGLAVVGVLLVLADSVLGWGAIAFALAVLFVLAAVALAVLALLAPGRQAVTVTLDDEGFSVRSPQSDDHSGRWADVTRVTAAPGRITLHEGDERRTHLIAPTGSDADLEEIGHAISAHLDTNRGYTTFTG